MDRSFLIKFADDTVLQSLLCDERRFIHSDTLTDIVLRRAKTLPLLELAEDIGNIYTFTLG